MDIKDQPITDEKTKRLQTWKSEFLTDYRHHCTWGEKKAQWEDFYDGEQLSQEEKQALAARGQPEVVINLIAPRLDAIIGDFLERRVMMRARDKGTGDFETAKYITEALRYIEEQNRFDEQEALLAKNLFVGGQGWYKIGLEFDFLEPEIKITYRSYDDIVLDRRCKRADLKDGKRIWETVWVEVEDLIELYPNFKDEINAAVEMFPDNFENTLPGRTSLGDDYAISENNTNADMIDFQTFVDQKRRRLRLVNVWERVQKRIEFAFHPDLEKSVVELSDMSKEEKADFDKIYPDAQKFTRNRWEINSGIFIFNQELEYKENVRPHDSEGKFPFARAVGKTEHQSNMPYGVVKQYIDAQKEYNKRRSKLLHKTNTNRIVAAEGAIQDVERTRKEAARADGVVLFTPGMEFKIDGGEPSQADVYLLQLAQSEVESSGIAKEFTGTENSELSGKAIALRQVTSDKMLRQYYAAMRSARRAAFGIVLEEMQQYWTSEKLIKITDDPNAGMVALNQRVTNPDTGEVEIINNLRLGKYDIKIDEDIETANQRQENFQALVNLAEPIMKSGQPFPIEMLIQYSDMPAKEQLVQAIQLEKQRQLQIAQAQAIATAGAALQNGQDNVSPT